MGITRGIVFWLDFTARGNIDMYVDEVGEHFGNSILWSTCNDQLELIQVVHLNPTLEYV